MKGYDLNGEADVLGHHVDLDKITNPLLSAVIRQRIGKDFIFAYKDVHTDSDHKDYSDHREKYGDHVDHREKYDDKYDAHIAHSEGPSQYD